MEKDGFITVVPAYDSTEPAQVYHGLYPLIGIDWMETEADVTGLVPIRIEVPEWGWSKEIIEQAWRDYWKYTLGMSPLEQWWLPSFFGANKHLYESFAEWIGMLKRDHRYPAPQLWDSNFANQMYWSSMIPRRIVASACDACAKPGGWTLTTVMLTWHLKGGGKVRRWDPLLPDGMLKHRAHSSHITSMEDHMEMCQLIWLDHRAGLAKDDPAYSYATVSELSQDPEFDDLVSEINAEAAIARIRDVQETHVPLWHPPDWVVDDIDEQIKAKSKWAVRFGDGYKEMNIVTPIMDAWESAIYAENEGRRFFGG